MDEEQKQYSMDEKRSDVYTLFGLRGIKFAVQFLDLVKKYKLFDETIDHAYDTINGKTVVDALCGIVNADGNQSKGEFLVKKDDAHLQSPKKQDRNKKEITPYYDKAIGPYHNGEMFWVRKDFKSQFAAPPQGNVAKPARVKFFLTRFLGLSDSEVEKMWKMQNKSGEQEDQQVGNEYVTNSFDKSYPRNRIFFGAPGTGKSHLLNEQAGLGRNEAESPLLIEGNKEDYFERVTFHPEYSYAHFVGTYKPVPSKDKDGKTIITYEYVPGPFLRVYVEAQKAYIEAEDKKQAKPYLLIIEEINRANVAAVFGDVFQLLDREENGESEYPIAASEDILRFLKSEKGKNLVSQDAEKAELRIPPNMYIWATMNSADQGVFPMDTAFKRRWDFEYIGINDNQHALSNKSFQLVSGAVNWNEIRIAINDCLADLKVNEDKQLGPFFLSPQLVGHEGDNDGNRNEKFIKAFKTKVIMYLFEDAARQKRDQLFEQKRYSEVCSDFDSRGIRAFKPPKISGLAAREMAETQPMTESVDNMPAEPTGDAQ